MKKKMESNEEEMITKKGPWKAEEDQVLINHVNRYGPRDWSSIRSKGLLQRTGKSCRLRWVNKLRPNLKNGCKFTAEEERIVLELQSEFGNKWARIATYLPGRTDNDVKNFWSSRQKRLARVLHNSSDPSSSSSHRVKAKNVKSVKGKEEIITASSSSSSKMLPSDDGGETLRLPDLGIKLDHQPFTFGTDLVQEDTMSLFSPESRDLLAKLDDPFYYDILGPSDSSEPFFSLPFDPSPRRYRHVSKDEEPDVFLDDLPDDMFDQVDPIKSP